MNILFLVFCTLMAILSWLGIWTPNKFGTGMLWLLIGIYVFIMSLE